MSSACSASRCCRAPGRIATTGLRAPSSTRARARGGATRGSTPTAASLASPSGEASAPRATCASTRTAFSSGGSTPCSTAPGCARMGRTALGTCASLRTSRRSSAPRSSARLFCSSLV
ncbi:Zinc finger CCCH domain-containing protein 24 [Musa troglodytarum]|uniref:Zinc finger CCCH domain-containing protein 24 n=1 Tax=Musa troglodytarum TaxID=320322 RepID=A0A9E7KH40_9LILI|nr:Zinc finger CCCH domain-containing protein 24 [Musa troglodytarum]